MKFSKQGATMPRLTPALRAISGRSSRVALVGTSAATDKPTPPSRSHAPELHPPNAPALAAGPPLLSVAGGCLRVHRGGGGEESSSTTAWANSSATPLLPLLGLVPSYCSPAAGVSPRGGSLRGGSLRGSSSRPSRPSRLLEDFEADGEDAGGGASEGASEGVSEGVSASAHSYALLGRGGFGVVVSARSRLDGQVSLSPTPFPPHTAQPASPRCHPTYNLTHVVKFHPT